jgi:hypothetical protein
VSFLTKLPIDRYGRFLHCERQGRFEKANLAPDTSSDLPPFDDGVAKELRAHLHGTLSAAARIKLAASLLTGMNIANMRTDPGRILIELLPPRLRDHMPDRYIGACNG